MRLTALCALLLLGPTVAVGLAGDADLAEILDRAGRSYDLTEATVALADIRDAQMVGDSAELTVLHLRASLLVAELLRIGFEELPPSEGDRRREFGSRIDAIADEGLDLVGGLPESSERERIRADLIATKIRSDFRAKKYEASFKAGVERALELDPSNARAWVSSAKPFLFAEPEHGGDLNEAVRLLDRALELEPHLETALLLRAEARQQMGDVSGAAADRREALLLNPNCRPAASALALVQAQEE